MVALEPLRGLLVAVTSMSLSLQEKVRVAVGAEAPEPVSLLRAPTRPDA